MKGSPFAMLRDASPVSRLFIYRSVGAELDVQCCRRVDGSEFAQLSKLTRLHSLNLYRTVVDLHSLVAIVRSALS